MATASIAADNSTKSRGSTSNAQDRIHQTTVYSEYAVALAEETAADSRAALEVYKRRNISPEINKIINDAIKEASLLHYIEIGRKSEILQKALKKVDNIITEKRNQSNTELFIFFLAISLTVAMYWFAFVYGE